MRTCFEISNASPLSFWERATVRAVCRKISGSSRYAPCRPHPRPLFQRERGGSSEHVQRRFWQLLFCSILAATIAIAPAASAAQTDSESPAGRAEVLAQRAGEDHDARYGRRPGSARCTSGTAPPMPRRCSWPTINWTSAGASTRSSEAFRQPRSMPLCRGLEEAGHQAQPGHRHRRGPARCPLAVPDAQHHHRLRRALRRPEATGRWSCGCRRGSSARSMTPISAG